MLLNAEGNSKLKVKATALDIDDTYRELSNLISPDLEYIVKDIYSDFDRLWDVLICSHCIEHVPQPEKFVRRMCDLAREYVVISCPYKEDPDNLARSHINSIDDDFISQFNVVYKEVYNGFYWHQSDIVIFVVDAN